MATLHTSTTPLSSRVLISARSGMMGQSVVYLILILGTVVTLLPFVWAVLTSFKSASEIIRVPPTFFPQHWTLQSYQTIFNDPKVPLARFFSQQPVCGRDARGHHAIYQLAGWLYLRQIQVLGQEYHLWLYPGADDDPLPGGDDPPYLIL